MTEKRQTSQGYIIRILQHFSTKLRNITNFVMLFQAVMKFLSKFHLKGERSIASSYLCTPHGLISYIISRVRSGL
jgi:hypothetical protein